MGLCEPGFHHLQGQKTNPRRYQKGDQGAKAQSHPGIEKPYQERVYWHRDQNDASMGIPSALC